MGELTEHLVRLMRESVNASMEAAVRFQQQTWRMVDELVQRGAVAKEEGKRLLEEWTRRTEEFQNRMEEKYGQLEESLRKGLGSYLPPSRKDLEDLHRKLDRLMANLQAMSKKQPGRAEPRRRPARAKAKVGRKKR
jgi:polyhydroxyalkanoate synthesis regulator phasin